MSINKIIIMPNARRSVEDRLVYLGDRITALNPDRLEQVLRSGDRSAVIQVMWLLSEVSESTEMLSDIREREKESINN
tara:strand:+ start:4952 stop:5185 length:234 start_codon:yes stop_codon:yes gene_type:complete